MPAPDRSKTGGHLKNNAPGQKQTITSKIVRPFLSNVLSAHCRRSRACDCFIVRTFGNLNVQKCALLKVTSCNILDCGPCFDTNGHCSNEFLCMFAFCISGHV